MDGVKKNGEIVMDALRSLNSPTTLTSVINYIANQYQVESSQIREPIKFALEKAVEFGFIQKQGARYALDLSSEGPNVVDWDKHPQDRTTRRRSRSRRRRSRSGRRRSKSRKRSRH